MRFAKGTKVYVKFANGKPDRRTLYSVRSCGKVRAVIDRLDINQELSGFRHKVPGRSINLTPEASTYYYEERLHNTGQAIPSFIRRRWEQWFYPVDMEWDAVTN